MGVDGKKNFMEKAKKSHVLGAILIMKAREN